MPRDAGAPRQALDISQRLIPFHQAFTVPAGKAYCVYTHSHKGVVFYVGKGVASRPFQPGRNPTWNQYVQQLGTYEIAIVFWTDEEKRAYAEERRLIQTLRPACNVRDGCAPLEGGKAVKVSLLLPPEVMARIDAVCAQQQARLTTGRVERSSIYRDALLRGLEQIEAEAPPHAPPRPRRTGRKAVGDAA